MIRSPFRADTPRSAALRAEMAALDLAQRRHPVLALVLSMIAALDAASAVATLISL